MLSNVMSHLRPSRTHTRWHAPLSLHQSFLAIKGQPITIRLVTSGDTALLAAMFAQLSHTTCWLRYQRPVLSPEAAKHEARRLTERDARRHVALVVTVREAGAEQAVAVAELARTPHSAKPPELALVVRDEYQGMGLGTTLVRLLAQTAHTLGHSQLQVETLAENNGMLRLIEQLALPFTTGMYANERSILIDISALRLARVA